MSNELDLTQLREVAGQSTPGPWAVYDRGIGYEVHNANGYELNGGMRETFTEADATHIATFDPPTVLALLSRLEQAEQAVQRVREVCDSEAYEVTNEYGTYNAVAVDNIIEALDGDGRG